MSAASLLIRGARVLALDDADHEWPNADIVIVNGRIAAIGPNAAEAWPQPFDRVIEAAGMLAMPGLINAHLHSPGNLMKGRLDGLPLELFMLHEVPPLAATDTEGDDSARERMGYVCTMLGALEMLRRGITTVHDDAYHIPVATRGSVDAVMRAYEDAGMRATVTIDQPNVIEYDKLPYLRDLLPEAEREAMARAPVQSTEELLGLYAHLIERWHGAADGRLRAAVSCSAPQRVSDDYFHGLSALSRQHDLPFNIHLLETRLQRVLGEEKYGHSLVRHVHEMGLLDERVMAIHAIWIDAEDIALLAGANCTVAHNPLCNLRLGSGVMPWHALKAAGVTMGLGTDEMCSDDSTNLWAVMKLAALIHTLSDPDDRTWPKAHEVLRAATRGGAQALRQAHELGQLAPGCLADVILLDLDTHAFTPMNDLRRQLVYCEDGASVRMTIVAGRVVYEDGAVAGVDERALRAEARALAAQPVDTADAQRLEPHYRRMLEQAREVDVGMHRDLRARFPHG